MPSSFELSKKGRGAGGRYCAPLVQPALAVRSAQRGQMLKPLIVLGAVVLGSVFYSAYVHVVWSIGEEGSNAVLLRHSRQNRRRQ